MNPSTIFLRIACIFLILWEAGGSRHITDFGSVVFVLSDAFAVEQYNLITHHI